MKKIALCMLESILPLITTFSALAESPHFRGNIIAVPGTVVFQYRPTHGPWSFRETTTTKESVGGQAKETSTSKIGSIEIRQLSAKSIEIIYKVDSDEANNGLLNGITAYFEPDTNRTEVEFAPNSLIPEFMRETIKEELATLMETKLIPRYSRTGYHVGETVISLDLGSLLNFAFSQVPGTSINTAGTVTMKLRGQSVVQGRSVAVLDVGGGMQIDAGGQNGNLMIAGYQTIDQETGLGLVSESETVMSIGDRVGIIDDHFELSAPAPR